MMRIGSRILILLIIGLLLSPAVAYAQKENRVQLVVNVTLSDGTPIAGVMINITQGDVVVASEVTDEYGQAIFLLPANQTYSITASYGVWSETKTVMLSQTEIITFIASYGLPIDTYELPLRLTIWTPGGFIMTFEGADNVTAQVVTFQPGLEYQLNVKSNYINFETNESGMFIVNVHVTYKRLDWYTGSIVTYSKAALVRTTMSFSFYSRNLEAKTLVESIVGPHYPTPEEIAKAQLKYLTQVKNDILQQFSKSNTELLVRLKYFEQMLNKTGEDIEVLGKSTSEMVKGLTGNMWRFFTNTWIGQLMMAGILIFAIIVMLMTYRSRGEKEVLYPDEIVEKIEKRIKHLEERLSIEAQRHPETLETRPGRRMWLLIIIGIVVAGAVAIWYLGYTDDLIWMGRELLKRLGVR